MKNVFLMLGRIFLSLFFIAEVTFQILNWDGANRAFAKSVTDWAHYSAAPLQIQKMFNFLLSYSSMGVLVGAILAGLGGLFVLLGVKVRFGAILLIVFLIGMTVIMHGFWMYSGSVRDMEMAAFIKNITILGGLFILAATSGGGEA